MDRFQMDKFRCSRNLAGDVLLMVSGSPRYKAILARAFPELYFSSTFADKFGSFTWGTYIKRASEGDERAICGLCELFQQVVYLADDLDECFALAFHTQTSSTGGYERTPIGQLVYTAKPYNRVGSPGDREQGVALAELLAGFVEQHPTYRRADLLVSVPPSNTNKDFDLPALLVAEIARRTGKRDATAAVRKTRATRPMKDCLTVQEKVDNLHGAFAADPAVVRQKCVVLIDDIYQSGFSIHELGRSLRQAGASLVLGLVASKTARDLSEETGYEL
jgi:predicted amidophosphoribosyltransferase